MRVKAVYLKDVPKPYDKIDRGKRKLVGIKYYTETK